MRWTGFILGLAALSPPTLARGQGSETSAVAAPESPTFAEHVAPIIFNNCVSCHRPGEVAPMSFTSYDETRPWVKSIRTTVAARTMPPWKAKAGVGGPWEHDPTLSQAEIDTIVRWVELGAPMGDPAKTPALPSFPDPKGWTYGEPDVVATFEEITVPAGGDAYWGPTAPITIPEGKWLRGIEIIPSNPAIAHHIVIYAGDYQTMGTTSSRDSEGKSYRGAVRPGEGKYGLKPDSNQGIAGNAMLGARGAGGSNALMNPEGFGRPLPPNVDKLTGEFHFYNAGDKEAKCQVKVGLHFGEGELQKVVHLHAPMNFNIYIEPGKEGVESSGYHVFDQDSYLTSMTPHFHILGRDMTYTAVYPDGKRETLLDAVDLDFNWQRPYVLKEPKLLPAGTRVEFLGHWRDPAKSPDHPVNKPVVWGAAAFDEMAFGIITYYVAEGKEERPPQWSKRVKEYLEWFPSPDHHEGTAKSSLMGFPAIMTLKEGGAPTLRIALPAILGHGLFEIRFTESKWDGKSFTAASPPGGFYGGNVTMVGAMTEFGPEVTAITFSDLARSHELISGKPWTFKPKAAPLVAKSSGAGQ